MRGDDTELRGYVGTLVQASALADAVVNLDWVVIASPVENDYNPFDGPAPEWHETADSGPTREGLAKAVLSMAASGGMPDSFWLSDGRILDALLVLDWTPAQAQEWAAAEISS